MPVVDLIAPKYRTFRCLRATGSCSLAFVLTNHRDLRFLEHLGSSGFGVILKFKGF